MTYKRKSIQALPSSPLVSVIIPTYNPGLEIEKSLYSITRQSYKNMEIIIVDDSSDNKILLDVIKELNDKRIVLKTNDKRGGIVEALNYGILISKGKYIARMDADDISHEDRILLQVKYMEENPQIDILGTMAYMVDEHDNIIDSIIHHCEDFKIKLKMLYNSPIIHPSVIIRKESLKGRKYEVNAIVSEDYDLWTRCISDCQFHNLPYRLIKYRVGNESLSAQLRSNGKNKEKNRKIMECYGNIYDRMYAYYNIAHKNGDYIRLLSGFDCERIDLDVKEKFVRDLSNDLKNGHNDTKYVKYEEAYQWIRLTGYKFIFGETFEIRMVCMGIIVWKIITKITSIIKGIFGANRRVYNWNY